MAQNRPARSQSLKALSYGVEHWVANGTQLTGVLPQKETPSGFTFLGGTEGDLNPVTVPNRHTWSIGPPDDGGAADMSAGTSPVDGNGLFDFEELFQDSANDHAWVSTAHIQCSAGTSWVIAVTTGLNDGDPATTVDDPAGDAELASGTGTAWVKLNHEILRGHRIRITTAAAVTADSRFCLHITNTFGEGGRLIS